MSKVSGFIRYFFNLNSYFLNNVFQCLNFTAGLYFTAPLLSSTKGLLHVPNEPITHKSKTRFLSLF